MKKALIIYTLLATMTVANAQPAMNSAKWEENNPGKSNINVAKPNQFTATEMSLGDAMITFSYLPDVPKTTMAIITDATGETITQKKISRADNTIDVHKLHKGELYFVTLVYKNKGQKAFVVHL